MPLKFLSAPGVCEERGAAWQRLALTLPQQRASTLKRKGRPVRPPSGATRSGWAPPLEQEARGVGNLAPPPTYRVTWGPATGLSPPAGDGSVHWKHRRVVKLCGARTVSRGLSPELRVSEAGSKSKFR